jgi:hypothetical protein
MPFTTHLRILRMRRGDERGTGCNGLDLHGRSTYLNRIETNGALYLRVARASDSKKEFISEEYRCNFKRKSRF